MFLINLLFKNGVRQIVISGYLDKKHLGTNKKQDRYRCECVCVFKDFYCNCNIFSHLVQPNFTFRSRENIVWGDSENTVRIAGINAIGRERKNVNEKFKFKKTLGKDI